jgi:hypothetical protein
VRVVSSRISYDDAFVITQRGPAVTTFPIAPKPRLADACRNSNGDDDRVDILAIFGENIVSTIKDTMARKIAKHAPHVLTQCN